MIRRCEHARRHSLHKASSSLALGWTGGAPEQGDKSRCVRSGKELRTCERPVRRRYEIGCGLVYRFRQDINLLLTIPESA